MMLLIFIIIGQMKLGGQDIQWCQFVKYLAVYLMAGKKLCFDRSTVKRCFLTVHVILSSNMAVD